MAAVQGEGVAVIYEPYSCAIRNGRRGCCATVEQGRRRRAGCACRCRFAREGEVAFVVPARVYGRPVLPLLPRNGRAAGRLPASL